MIVAPYLTEEARVVCREAGVGYFDLAGNAGLDTPHIFIEIGGKPNPEPRKKEVQTLYQGRAERVVRTLLMDPERRWNMRDSGLQRPGQPWPRQHGDHIPGQRWTGRQEPQRHGCGQARDTTRPMG